MTSGHRHISTHWTHADHGKYPHHRWLAVKEPTFSVSFSYQAPHAKVVVVMGTFHDGAKHPMQRAVDGYWHAKLELKRGRHEYRFLVDGVPTLDPRSFGTITHFDGTKSSLLEVGY